MRGVRGMALDGGSMNHSPTATERKRFRVKRIFICDVEADKPSSALAMVRAAPDLFDTDIVEDVELLTDEQEGGK